MTKLLDKYKSGGGKKFPPVGAGTYPARIAQIIDLGLQKDSYQGEESVKPKLFITFELPTKKIEIDGEMKPRWISREYTKSTHEMSALTSVIMAVCPDASSFEDLLGKPCLIQTGLTSGGNDKIISVAPEMEGMVTPPLANGTVFYDLEHPSQAIYDNLPRFLQEKIDNRIVQGKPAAPSKDPFEGTDEDLPF